MAEAFQLNGDTAPQVAHDEMANAIRVLSMDAVQRASSGHPGMPMGMADVATVLFSRFLKFDATDPDWPDRDRFILSAGHGSMLLYALLYLTSGKDVDLDGLRSFRQLGSLTPGHPEVCLTPGVDTTTGPLGQGLGNAVGMALAERLLNQRHGDEICNHFTYVIAGDGCLMEGISHESVSLAGHLGLGKLIVLFDDNQITIDGPTDLTVSDDNLKRFEACNWHVARCDGHDPEAVALAIENARGVTDRPSLIACRSIIGYGAPTKQGDAASHGAPLGEAEVAGTREQLDWPHAPFEVPTHVLAAWRAIGTRGRARHQAWRSAVGRLDPTVRARLIDPIDEEIAVAIGEAIREIKAAFLAEAPKLATRQSSQKVLEKLIPMVPGIVGGSADLTGSNGTQTSHHEPIESGNYSGNYIYYGVREHAMAAAMNGLALHGGFVPYGGSFLIFADYCCPAIRLSAMMKQRVVYVMTHDSIGLGEDGPTHQPVEQLAGLRAMPNLQVLRPADAVECAECWQVALTSNGQPSVLALTRQGVEAIRTAPTDENLSAKGAYVLSEPDGGRDVTLLATGSEVAVAIEAAAALGEHGVSAAVVSMPCWELFEAQPQAYQNAVLGTAPRVAVEAAVRLGWDRWIGSDGAFVGMTGYGTSAPTGEIFTHFGITAEKVAEAAREVIDRGH